MSFIAHTMVSKLGMGIIANNDLQRGWLLTSKLSPKDDLEGAEEPRLDCDNSDRKPDSYSSGAGHNSMHTLVKRKTHQG